MSTKFRHMLLLALAVPTLVMVPGCLIYETTHTLYLEPAGTVRWLVLQKDVRSDADDAMSRHDEELEFVDAVYAGDHPAARDLWAVGASRVVTRIIRDERPYAVATEGEFPSIETLARAFFENLGARAEVHLRRDGRRVELAIILDIGEEGTDPDSSGEALMSLLGDAGDYRLVLTAGRFIEAAGFELEDDGTVAVPVAPSGEGIERGDLVMYRLTWEVD